MTAWLLELDSKKGPCRCLGECSGVFVLTTPDSAIRFAREEDAVAVARVYKDMQRRSFNLVAREHSWE